MCSIYNNTYVASACALPEEAFNGITANSSPLVKLSRPAALMLKASYLASKQYQDYLPSQWRAKLLVDLGKHSREFLMNSYIDQQFELLL